MPSIGGDLVHSVIEWDGTDQRPEAWAQQHQKQILAEARTGSPGLIASELDQLIHLADQNASAASFGLGELFSSLQDAVATVFHKLWGFVSAGARHVKPLWNALATLFHRYADKIRKIARKLGADSYTLALNIPMGFSLGLSFGID